MVFVLISDSRKTVFLAEQLLTSFKTEVNNVQKEYNVKVSNLSSIDKPFVKGLANSKVYRDSPFKSKLYLSDNDVSSHFPSDYTIINLQPKSLLTTKSLSNSSLNLSNPPNSPNSHQNTLDQPSLSTSNSPNLLTNLTLQDTPLNLSPKNENISIPHENSDHNTENSDDDDDDDDDDEYWNLSVKFIVRVPHHNFHTFFSKITHTDIKSCSYHRSHVVVELALHPCNILNFHELHKLFL